MVVVQFAETTIYNEGKNLELQNYLQYTVLPLSNSSNTVDSETLIICLGQYPKNISWPMLVIKLLPVRGVLPDPDKTRVVLKPLCETTRILYRKAERCEQKLAEKKGLKCTTKHGIMAYKA